VKRFDERERRKSILKSITPGKHLKLRDDILGHIQPRRWVFKRIDGNDTIFLMDESGGFGWSVKIDNIDWEAYGKQSGKKLFHQN
jgi:hypothetical protein